MAHPRQLIRQAVRNLLLNQTAAGTNVVTTRVLPYRKEDLPAISVYTLEEEVDPDSVNTGPRELERQLVLEIAGWVKYGAGMDDAQDDLALEIETAMHADPTFGGTAAESVLAGTVMSIKGESSDSLLGLVTLTYQVTYRTLAPEAPANLDDFERVEATHAVTGGVDDTVPAVDSFTVEAP